mgnify:CR=1 FL=1
MINIRPHTGPLDDTTLQALAGLRLTVFRDFPYLYEGTMEDEMAYLQPYMASPDSLVVLALDGEKVIGASTGIPMEHETDNIKAPWAAKGYDVNRIFYFGESVLLKEYRGRGIGVEFFRHREAWAKQLGRFDWMTFCGVVRPASHPLKPQDYVPLDSFWEKRGFTKTADLVCYIKWKDLNDSVETEKPLHFWYKQC